MASSTSRRDFLNQPAPENYVAGLGRGATGFTTRSDLGPAREGPSEDQIKAAVAKRSAQLGLTSAGGGASGGKDDGGGGGGDDDDGGNDARYQDPDNEVGLFAGGIYTKDDEEDDRAWREVDDKMARRRQKQREAREQAEREEYERKNPKIQQQFAGLKRALASVSDEEWASLPDAKDMTGRTKRARQERLQRFYAVPDSVLAANRDAGEYGTAVAEDGTATGTATENGGNGSGGQDGTVTDFAKIGAARDKVLQARLEQASHSNGAAAAGSASSIDPRGYLTSLSNSQQAGGPGSEQSIGDVEQFRKMMKSAVDSNPKQASSWIAAARLEVHAGKPGAARNLIAKGCEFCPRSEDIWLENMHLNDVRNAKVIAASAIQHNPHSVRLWVEAMKLEVDPRSRRKVMRRALDNNPESEALWKEAVNLEEDVDDARMLLAKATELIPGSLDLWLALARLETPENARKVLNRAVKKLPSSHELWVAAARLEEQLELEQQQKSEQKGEQQGEQEKQAQQQRRTAPIMKNAVRYLAKQNAMPKREVWLAEAEKCEEEGAVATCASIVEETLGWGLDEDDDRKEIWMEDAKASVSRGRLATARAIYAYALRVFANSKTLWLAAVELERQHGGPAELWAALEKAVQACPAVEAFWLMLAKEKEKACDLDAARLVLGRAFKQNPDNEDIWLAAVKLEADNGFTAEARQLLQKARQDAPTDRVWMRSVAFERQLGDDEAALDLVQGALRLFPGAPKLWMMKGQIYEALGRDGAAREAYGAGVKAAPSSVPLWLLYARLEERSGNVVKARSVLDRARQAVPRSPELWRELVRVERRAGNAGQARSLMAGALQQMPRSGALWTERILHLEPRTQRKPLLAEALKKVEDDPDLLVAAARILWAERKLDRAQTWFEKALVLDRDRGDTWAWYFRFLAQHGTDERRADLVAKCVLNEPRHGEVWQAVAKDPKNAGRRTEELLRMVADRLDPTLG